MVKFLHASDIHLAISRYRKAERSEDFYLALLDVFQKYAVDEKVDFVILGGDIFDMKAIPAWGMDQAVKCLSLLKDNNIPVIAITGNHDCPDTFTNFSWLKSLNKLGYINYLEENKDAQNNFVLQPWDEESRTGGYYDIGNVRIYGTSWAGSSITTYVEKYLEALKKTYDPKKFNIMLLHTEVEGQLNKPIPGITVEQLSVLKDHVDYLALGHIHKKFEIDGWIYNPGSVEACNIEEFFYEHGVFLVELKRKKFTVEHITDYRRRPMIRHKIDLSLLDIDQNIQDQIYNNVISSIDISVFGELLPILELTLEGQSDIKTSDIKPKELKERLEKYFFVVIIKNISVPIDFGIKLGHDRVDRGSIAKSVLSGLLTEYANNKNLDPQELANHLMTIKDMANLKDDPESIASYIERNIYEPI